MKVRYIKRLENEARHMTLGKEYIVIGVEADYYRLINDHGDPCLYEAGQCEIVDFDEPSFWVSETGEDGEQYSYPLEFHEVGFFEDYHDGNRLAVDKFWAVCEKLYGLNKNV